MPEPERSQYQQQRGMHCDRGSQTETSGTRSRSSASPTTHRRTCGGICTIAKPAHDAVSSVTPAPIVLTSSELPSCRASGITPKMSR